MNKALLAACLVLCISGPSCTTEPASTAGSPAVTVGEDHAARVAEALDEFRAGTSSAIVTAPEDPAIDSAEFVEAYLRAFEEPDDLGPYDYRFERLLDRVSNYPKPLKDPKLDEPVWHAYVIFETKRPGMTSYPTSPDSVEILDSARDLLWMYLNVNAPEIRKDPERRKRWMERLLSPGTELERVARGFAAIHLISSIQEDEGPELVVDDPPETRLPKGTEGLNWFARQKSVSWTLWGADPQKLPAPKVEDVPAEWFTKRGVDQESWSKARTNFEVSYRRVKGRRTDVISVWVPPKLETDGLFMLYASGRLHVWPKKQFFEGILSLLQETGFLEPDECASFGKRLEIVPLTVTARSDR